MCVECDRLEKLGRRLIMKAEDDLCEELREMGYIAPEVIVEAIDELEERARDSLLKETALIIATIKGASSLTEFIRSGVLWLRDQDTLHDDLAADISDVVTDAVLNMAEEYSKQNPSGIVVEQLRKSTQAWIKDVAGRAGESIQETSLNQISKILDRDEVKDWSLDEFLDAVREARNDYHRARLIAVDKVLVGYSSAQQEVFFQDPSIEGKAWYHSVMTLQNPREHHLEMHGLVVRVDEPFIIYAPDGTYEAMFPRDGSLPDSETINCHCFMQPQINTDLLDLALDELRTMQWEALAKADLDWENEYGEIA